MKIVDKKTGAISLAELSKFNGESEVENAKKIINFLAQKAEFYDTPQTIILTYQEVTNAK